MFRVSEGDWYILTTKMTVLVELPDNEGEALAAMAAARGLSLPQYLGRLAQDSAPAHTQPLATTPRKPISAVIAEIMADVPAAELAKLPLDGASEHDHYIYGWRRRSHHQFVRRD